MSFRILPHTIDFDASAVVCVAKLNYAFDDEVHFTEEFVFPRTIAEPLTSVQLEAIDRALLLLSLAAGVSYYKAKIPPRLVVESGPLTKEELQLMEALYTQGLGEFAYVNGLDLTGRPQFEVELIDSRPKIPLELSRRSLIAIGGGKDSCVTVETMRAGGDLITLASVNKARPIVDVIAASGLPGLHVERKLSPELFRLNEEGAYNGHVPVTAIVSLALVVAALLNDCDAVVMSNERSASIGNVEHNGEWVNHQYSKGLEAETLMASAISTSISSELNYFSLLRPLSELEIARRFSRMTRYHDVFTSCNRAFHIDKSRRIDRWCGNCPKCRFVFLSLAPFMDRERLVEIIGADLLNDPAQFGGFDELIGWDAFKPFECVGEIEESIAALMMISEQEQWQDAVMVHRFNDEILSKMELPPNILEEPFNISSTHNIPEQFARLLNATA